MDISRVYDFTMTRMFLAIVAAVSVAGCATTTTEPTSLDAAAPGRWAVRVEGRPLVIIDLKRDLKAPGGWAGSSTVGSFQMSEEHVFSKIKGPGRVRPIIWSNVRRSDLLEFKVEPDSDTYTFQVMPNGTARMGWKGISVPPLVLSRASGGEQIPTTWDPASNGRTEDGHI